MEQKKLVHNNYRCTSTSFQLHFFGLTLAISNETEFLTKLHGFVDFFALMIHDSFLQIECIFLTNTALWGMYPIAISSKLCIFRKEVCQALCLAALTRWSFFGSVLVIT